MLDFFMSRYSSMRTHVCINTPQYEDTCGGMGCFSCLRQAFCRVKKIRIRLFVFSHAVLLRGYRDRGCLEVQLDQFRKAPQFRLGQGLALACRGYRDGGCWIQLDQFRKALPRFRLVQYLKGRVFRDRGCWRCTQISLEMRCLSSDQFRVRRADEPMHLKRGCCQYLKSGCCQYLTRLLLVP